MINVEDQFWVVGAGGGGASSPVFLSANWPPDLAGPISNAQKFSSPTNAQNAAKAARNHKLGESIDWKIYRVENHATLIPEPISIAAKEG